MIDGQKINEYIEANKNKKPPPVNVDQQEWEDALDGCSETLWEGAVDTMTTQEFWTLIYFSALYFCKGMERSEVKAGLKPESLYPRY